MNYIKRFHKAKKMAASVGNKYSEEDLMQTFVDNFQLTWQVCSSAGPATLRIEEGFKEAALGLLFG